MLAERAILAYTVNSTRQDLNVAQWTMKFAHPEMEAIVTGQSNHRRVG